MRGFLCSLLDVFADQSDRCVIGYAGNGLHCASVGLVLHWILINCSVLHDGVVEGKLGRENPGNKCTPESGPSTLILPTVKLSRKELQGISGSYDCLDELHAAGK